MAITYRNTKGSPLTFTELDANFSDLDTLKAPKASPTFTGTTTVDVLTVTGNTTLGNAGTDTITTNGNVTINTPTSGPTLTLGISPDSITSVGWRRTLPLGTQSAIEFDSGAAGAGRYHFI